MPTVLRWRGYRFFFYSNEGSEPPHVHVLRDEMEAKIWLHDLSVAASVGYAPHELNDILRKLAEHREDMIRDWHDYFGN